MIGNCPKCGTIVRTANVNSIEITSPEGRTFKGVSYLCQGCNCVLSVAIDPIALKTDIVSEVLKGVRALGRG